MGYTHHDGIDVENLKIDGAEVTASAAELNKLDSATVTAADLNLLDGQAASATFTVGEEAGGTINVAVQLKDADGDVLTSKAALLCYLADDALGGTITATAPDGHWAIGTDGLLIPVVTDKAAFIVSEADGAFDVDIAESSTATWYMVAVLPNGNLNISGTITFA